MLIILLPSTYLATGQMNDGYGICMVPSVWERERQTGMKYMAQVNRMSMYVHTKIMRTSRTMPSVIQVVPRPLLDTDDRFFFDDRVADRFSNGCQCVVFAGVMLW